MGESIQNYVKSKQLESNIADGLMDQLSGLIATRNEMASDLTQVEMMIGEITNQMHKVGINTT